MIYPFKLLHAWALIPISIYDFSLRRSFPRFIERVQLMYNTFCITTNAYKIYLNGIYRLILFSYFIIYPLILCIRKCSIKIIETIQLAQNMFGTVNVVYHHFLLHLHHHSIHTVHFLLLHGRVLTTTTAAATTAYSFLFTFLLLVHDDDDQGRLQYSFIFFYCWLLRFFYLIVCSVQPFMFTCKCVCFFLICWRIFIFTRKNWVLLFSSK